MAPLFRNAFRRNPKVRHCPVDWHDLEAHHVEAFGRDVRAERCPTCQGIYFDKGELFRATGNVGLHLLLTRYKGRDSDSRHICPGCGHIMDAETAGKTRVDVCLLCEGVWLDHGELKALKELGAMEALAFDDEKRAELERARAARRAELQKMGRAFFRRR